jgi:hypothetical protein
LAGIANPFAVEVTSAGLTTSITAYTSGDQLGTEITVAIGGGASAYAVITSVTMVDFNKVLGAIDVRVHRATTTPAADNAAAAWSDADADKLIPGGIISLPPPVVDANNGVAVVPNLWIMGRTDASGNFYADCITRSANAVFGAVGDLHLKFGGFYFS